MEGRYLLAFSESGNLGPLLHFPADNQPYHSVILRVFHAQLLGQEQLMSYE